MSDDTLTVVEWPEPPGGFTPTITPEEERLRPVSIREMREQLKKDKKRSWAAVGILPAATQSALAAPRKSFKSYGEIDLQVSIASGMPFLGTIPTVPAPVVMYASEFERATFDIRLDAICRSRGIDPDRDLDLMFVNFRPPRFLRPDDVAGVTRFAREREAQLVTIDPFYKSAVGVKLNDLVAAGSALTDLTESLAEIGCGLRIIHHARKAGGEGLDVFSGVGLVEWARVVSTMRKDGSLRRFPGGWAEQDVLLDIEGNDIAPRSYRVTFRIRGDERVLDGPKEYEVSVSDADDLTSEQRLPIGKRRVLSALASGEWIDVAVIQEATAHDGGRSALRMNTVSTYLRELEEEGLVEGTEGGRGRPRRWRKAASGPEVQS